MRNASYEYTRVERPLIDQLKSMGWAYIEGDTQTPAHTERQSFREVLLKERLRGAMRRINRDDTGEPWLDDGRVNQAVSALERLGEPNLMEANQRATELLIQGTTVEGDSERHAGREQIVHFIDYDHPERNDFLVINQFRVDPPWAVGNKDYIIPDLVLFVNGIPLVVIECKSPDITDPVAEGIKQLLRYTNQRDWIESDTDEGAEPLFHYNQFLVSTDWHEARVGTIAASYEHYLEWKDTSPAPLDSVAANLGVEKLTSQQMLVAGMLTKTNLLDIVRNFALFSQTDGKTIKIVPRYQQFRAVQKAVDRLRTGRTRHEHGEMDQRGGIIWHTQGSGKSLTMVFLLRKMRTLPDLRRFKVVVVTDRKNLEEQLSDTATLTGENVRRARNINQLKGVLAEQGPDLVFATIQKYQDRDQVDEDAEAYEYENLLAEAGVLNPSDAILVLIDEAHRSHATALHANLMRALPNCAKIGFTGTPIIMGKLKQTHEIFGKFIDVYRLEDAEADGEIVPILYEGKTAVGDITDRAALDRGFIDMFRDRTTAELEAIKARYATHGDLLEATGLIAEKADDILRHYIANSLPDGFKAMVVATSRLAAVRYQEALVQACARLIQQIESLPSAMLDADVEQFDAETQFLVRGYPHLETIRRLAFATVISEDRNQDDPAWRRWSAKSNIDAHIERFRQPLVDADPAKQDGLAFLCVKSMLLTGFDAPVAQVLYLDRSMRGHELLQAIARVNRTCGEKRCGYVVDYNGIAHHLQEALAAYSAKDIKGSMKSLADELPKLEARHGEVLGVFQAHGLTDISDEDACVMLLEDIKIRAEFVVKLKAFLEQLNIVLPRPEGLPYVRDAKRLGKINKVAANLYRDPQLNIVGVGNKVRELIDQHIISHGIDPKIPPISILDANFERTVESHRLRRTQAAEMTHALRHHISTHVRENPVYYQKLSEHLESILASFKENWDAVVNNLKDLTAGVRQGRTEPEAGLSPQAQPFFDLLAEAVGKNGEIVQEQLDTLKLIAVKMVEHIRQEIQIVDFWRSPYNQDVLTSWIVDFIDGHDILPFDRLVEFAEGIMDLAKARQASLIV